MPLLGDRLKELQAAQDDEQAKLLVAQQAFAQDQESKRKARIVNFFEQAKRIAQESIDAGKIPPPFITPVEVPGNGSYTILDATHPDHHLFADFKTWAWSEGMTVDGQHHQAGLRSAAKLILKAQK